MTQELRIWLLVALVSLWSSVGLCGCYLNPIQATSRFDATTDVDIPMFEDITFETSKTVMDSPLEMDVLGRIDAATDPVSADSGLDLAVLDRSAGRIERFEAPVRRIYADCCTACVVLRNGSVYCWGETCLSPGFSNEGTSIEERSLPRRIEGLRDIEQFAHSCSIGCGVDRNHDVWCLGEDYGSLQTGSAKRHLSVAQRRLDVRNILQVAPISVAFLGRAEDGSLYARPVSPPTLQRFSLPSPVVDIQIGFDYCVLLADGRVACAYDLVSPPRIVEGVDNVISIASGLDHFCAAKRDGTLWCWGENEYGQAGAPVETSDLCPREPTMRDGMPVYPYFYCLRRPRQVAGVSDVVEVRAETHATCVLKRDGTIWCWGSTFAPQTDTCPTAPWSPPRWTPPPTQCRLSPAQIMGFSDIVSFDMGRAFLCALRSSGEVWCWGNNALGSLGIGYGLSPSRPVLVPASAQGRDE